VIYIGRTVNKTKITALGRQFPSRVLHKFCTGNAPFGFVWGLGCGSAATTNPQEFRVRNIIVLFATGVVLYYPSYCRLRADVTKYFFVIKNECCMYSTVGQC